MAQSLSVVIPALNEERGLAELVEAVRAYCDEVLVVDGGSTDRTVEEARRAGARVVFDGGHGKGAAVRMGLAEARHEVVVLMDADWSHSPADITRLVQPLFEDRFDLVIGSRVTGGSDDAYGTFEKLLRRMGCSIITWGINLRFGTKLTESQNGFRAIRKSVAEQLALQENITTIEQEMLIKCLRLGFRVGEIPCFEASRRFGHSRIRLVKVFPRYVLNWLSLLLAQSR